MFRKQDTLLGYRLSTSSSRMVRKPLVFLNLRPTYGVYVIEQTFQYHAKALQYKIIHDAFEAMRSGSLTCSHTT